MKSRYENQKRISNTDVDWAKQYDLYEVEFRDIYRTFSKPQNDSHYEMLQNDGKRYLGKDKTFCEIGFSAGLTLRYSFKHFGKVYGIDISPKNAEITREELIKEGYSDFELFDSDILKFDKRFENKFDVISFIHGLEHFSINDYPVVLSNIKKYLKPGGVFTGALPYNLPFNFRMCPNCSHIFEIDGHVSIHNNNTLRQIFVDNEFEIIHLNNFNLKYSVKNAGTSTIC
jgi:ubiquinone/menaquinone biosynthesis C-methylase UbiE